MSLFIIMVYNLSRFRCDCYRSNLL